MPIGSTMPSPHGGAALITTVPQDDSTSAARYSANTLTINIKINPDRLLLLMQLRDYWKQSRAGSFLYTMFTNTDWKPTTANLITRLDDFNHSTTANKFQNIFTPFSVP